MVFIKILKIFFLLFFSLLFVLVFTLLQIDYTLKNTVLSSKYFNKVFDENIKTESLQKLADSFIDNAEQFVPLNDADKKALKEGKLSPELKNMIESYKEMLRKSIDLKWLTTEISKMVKGFFAYYTGGSNSLPPLDIKPLKSVLVNMYAEQISAHSGDNSGLDTDKIIRQIEEVPGGILDKDGNVNEKAVDELMKIQVFQSSGISKEAAGRIVEKIGKRSEEGTTNKEIYDFILKSILQDKMGISNMKDELDFNLLFETLYGSAENPMTAARAAVVGIKGKILTFNILIFLILLLIIAVVSFYPKSILRWSGAGFILSGGICLTLSGLSGIAVKLITDRFAEIQVSAGKLDLLFIQEWIQSYLGSIIRFILIQAIIIIIAGIAFIILSFHISSPEKAKDRPGPVVENKEVPFFKRKIVINLARILAIILLIAPIPLSITFLSNKIGYEITAFNEIKTETENQKDKISVNEALDKVLDSTFLKAMSGGGNSEGGSK